MLKTQQLALGRQSRARHHEYAVELLDCGEMDAEPLPAGQVDDDVREAWQKLPQNERDPAVEGRPPRGRLNCAEQHHSFTQAARPELASWLDLPFVIKERAGWPAEVGVEQRHAATMDGRQRLREMDADWQRRHALATWQQAHGAKCAQATGDPQTGDIEVGRSAEGHGIESRPCRRHQENGNIVPRRGATSPDRLKIKNHDGLHVGGLIEHATRILLFAACLAPSAPAHAKTSLQAQLTASAGWSDNVNNSTSTGGTPRSDFTFVLSPGLVLTTGSPRAVQQLAYNFGATLFARESTADSFSNVVSWSGFFLPSKTTTFGLNAGLTQSRLNGFSAAAESSSTQLQVMPTGAANLLTAVAGQRFGWEFHPGWRLEQAITFGATIPLERQSGRNNQYVTPALSLQKSWSRDLGALDVALTYSNYEAVRGPVVAEDGTVQPDGILVPRQQTLFNQGMLRWRHDYGRFVTSELGAGAVVILNAVDGSGRIIEPIGLAAIHFLYEVFQSDLSYQRTAAPNTLVGQSFLSDAVTLRAVTLLGRRTGLSLAGSVGYDHARQIDAVKGQVNGLTDLIVADATLNYMPRVEVGLFFRYQYLDQIGNDNGAPGAIASYRRNTLLLGIRGVYPGAASAVVPKGASRRVDGSDLVAIPEPHTKEQK
jgi:hypothetical protein